MRTTTRPDAVTIERDRLGRLTLRGPAPTRMGDLLAVIAKIRDHAIDRALFYSQCGEREEAELWSELAVEADYRIECITADTWAWPNQPRGAALCSWS